MSTETAAPSTDGLYIRDYYGVPAWTGGRIIYSGGHVPQPGTITGFDGPHLLVRLDGEQEVDNYHPTWCIEYVADEPSPVPSSTEGAE